MRPLKTLCILLLITISLFANNTKKFTNMNPDPDSEPRYLDYYVPDENPPMMSDEKIQDVLAKVTALPSKIDYSFSRYMRPVFNQAGGSCGSASRICYMFGYEINNYRNVTGTSLINQYPSHFTWLLTGQNSSKEEMAIFNGIPSAFYYNGNTFSTKYGGQNVGWPDLTEAPDYGWMNGYNRWENALNNRLEKNAFINLTTPENLTVLKSWMYDHHGDTDFQEGGVAGAGVATSGMNIVSIPAGMVESGKSIVKSWGPQVDHGTTWSGYDDSVAYDFNNDGKITNDIDITGDGKVDMADWEQGALIMLNSWGDSWENNGTVYVPYRLLKINNMAAEFYYIRKNYTPKKIMKIKMDYNKRCDLKLRIGISTDTLASLPMKTMDCHHFNYAGNGEVPMLGKWADGKMHEEPMEFCFDLTDLMENMDVSHPYDFYLKAATKRFTTGIGTIYSVSVVDYAKSQTGDVVYTARHSNLPIQGGDIKYISVRMPGETMDIPENVLIAQSAMTVYFVDSEETTGEDGSAVNVIDGDQSTIWHTEWSDTTPTHPHEIQLRFDQSYWISGFEYLPRQNSENGRIGQFEIYLSVDASDWGEPVATGIWPNSTERQTVLFEPEMGNLIKLVALSEVNGNEWTSCAEINILQKNPTTTSMENPTITTVSEFRLDQNYPNPFNPATHISFYISRKASVKLEIYNLLGRKITTLTNKVYSPGKHTISWNASDLPSGIYFYQLTDHKQSITRKMVLQK
ncbi:MAG: discoidin domain-containing protein [Candidatus Marinimicrobia bacterium]|nr:discoidin domain-containing protein [Candidatus Neomarinimicrobiota bacterium]